ncbi:MAG: beta-N-acetylhexosaminidase [Candidatus Aminicenantes bacterium]|nr:beta-N-acetylhexosaminidase [Candidatus Aminicenantes bacterium]
MTLLSSGHSLPSIFDGFSLKEKIGQMMMVGFAGPRLTRDLQERLSRGAAGFVLLFHHNVESVDQVVALTNEVHGSFVPAPMIWTDQEGGNVVQFGEIAATVLSPMGLAATGKRAFARLAGRIMGGEMRALGVDGVLAPVLDVNTRSDNPIIGFRSFSSDPRVVRRFGAALAGGLRRGGVATCGKHFPGHGGVCSDSHLDRPRCPASSNELDAVHLSPFRALIRSRLLDAVMPAHVVYPEVDANTASLSSHWLATVLRRQLKFKGLVISDCLEMGAVSRFMDPGEAAVMAVIAGVDVVAVSRSAEAQEHVFNTLVAAVKTGRIPISRVHEAVMRVLEIKHRRRLLRVPPRREIGKARERARSHYRDEFRIAAASITLVRDTDNILPLDRGCRLFLVEWKKVVATEALSQATARSVLADPLRRWFPHVDSEMLDLSPDLPQTTEKHLQSAGRVVLAVFSRSAEVEGIQAAAVQRALHIRPDAIVVALGNPFDLRGFPTARVFLATYGYRRIQAEALAAALAGEITPSGRLPVQIF